MNCIKEFLSILSLYMIFSAFHIEHLAGEKEILREGTCFDWFEHSAAESSISPRWSIGFDKKTCTICNPINSKKSWLFTKMVDTEGYNLIHVDVDIFRRYCKSCKSQDVKVLILNQTLPIRDQKKFQEILDKLRVLTILQNKEEDKSQTHHFQFQPTLSKFSIVFLSEGGCTRIERIEVSSFVCETKISNGVHLPRTVAPVCGFTRVKVSGCPENTLNPKNMEAYWSCSSEGMWKIISPCMCKKGFTLAAFKEGCKECGVNTYKDDVGNGKCYACPLNSKSDEGQHQCLCKDGFYRFMGDTFKRPCYGIPSAVRNTTVTDRTETSITLLWEPPERSGASGQNVLYDVECKKCQSGSDSKPCEDSCGTKVLYIPRQSNLAYTNVTIQNLDQDSEYEFVIYSKNVNSLRIKKSNWENTRKKIKTEAPCKEGANLARSDKIRRKGEILKPSPFAKLDKNRQHPRDTRDNQKLLKRDSGYLIPNDGGTETYGNDRVVKTEPGYKELDRTKRDQDDNTFYQKLINK